MPYKTEKIRLTPQQDRRRKLSEEEKEKIKTMTFLSQRKIAKLFGVSRRTIQFILFPGQKEENIQRRKERGGWKQYYNKEKHAEYTKNHRKYKNKILSNKKNI